MNTTNRNTISMKNDEYLFFLLNASHEAGDLKHTEAYESSLWYNLECVQTHNINMNPGGHNNVREARLCME